MEGGLNRDVFIKEDTVTIMVQPINLKKELVSFCKRDIVNTVKKQRILFITISILVMLLTACSSSKSSFPQLSKDGVPSVDEVGTIVESAMPYSEINGSAEPAVDFSSAEEAVKEIKAVKATDPKKMAHPDDFKLYDKKYVYLLKETPLPGFKQTSIMIILQGTSIIYQTDGGEEQAVFSWIQGVKLTKRSRNVLAASVLSVLRTRSSFLENCLMMFTFIGGKTAINSALGILLILTSLQRI